MKSPFSYPATQRLSLLVLLMLLFWGPNALTAQSSEIDSLLKIRQSRNDTLRINALNELARLHTPDSLTLAEQFARQALNDAKAKAYTKGIIYALRYQGLICDFKGELDLAIAAYDEALELTKDRPQWLKEHASLLINKGVAYYYAGDLGKALLYYLEAEPLYGQIKDEQAHAKLLNNMAVVYRQLSRYEDAIVIYQKSLKIKEQIQDSLGIANTLHNIGLAYGYLRNYAQTVQYMSRAKKSYEAQQQWSEAQSVNIALADALYELGRIQESKKALQELLASDDLKVTLHEILQSKLLLINIHIAEKDFQAAWPLVREVEPELLKTNFSRVKSSFYDLKAQVLYGQQQFEEAFIALRTHKSYTDTLLSEERLKLEKDMEAKYLTKEKDNLIQIQELRLLKNERERIAFALALLGLLLVFFLAYRLSRIRKKANMQLQEKNAQVQKALEEKEMLLKEIHHRVKNNLQVISSLLSLQSRHIEDPKALEAIQEGRNRVQSMALIHKHLYQDENLVGVNTVEYIENLTESLMANYQINPKQVTIVRDVDPMTLDVEVIIPLGLMLNELISNTLKYAFAEGQPGKLYLLLKRQGEGLHLRIADNGRGLPPEFNPEELSSLGFRLVKAFTQKLDGQLHIQSDHGTRVDITLPTIKAA